MGKYAFKNQNETNNFFNKGDKHMKEYHQISIFDFLETYIDNVDPLSGEELQMSFTEDAYLPDTDTDALFFEEYLSRCDPENEQYCSSLS